jgi:hypothetical protein
MEIRDITLKEYFELEDRSEYDFVMKYSQRFNEPTDIFGMGELTNRSFGFVKDLQYTFSEGVEWKELINFVEVLTGETQRKLIEYRFIDWCKFMAFMVESLGTISKLEEHLVYQTTGADEDAGISNLNKFGVFIQIDTLAKGDIRLYEQIRGLKYDLCFTKLLMDKEIQEYINNRSKVKK